MKSADDLAIGFELSVIVRRQAGHDPLRSQSLAWIEGQAEFDLVFLGRILKRILFGQFGGSCGIDLVARNPPQLVIHMEMQDGEPSFRGERSQKQALAALPVVDKLAAHGQMEALVGLREITNLHVRPVFAETVGQYAVRGWRAVEVHERIHSFEDTDALHGSRRSGAISNLYFDLRECGP